MRRFFGNTKHAFESLKVNCLLQTSFPRRTFSFNQQPSMTWTSICVNKYSCTAFHVLCVYLGKPKKVRISLCHGIPLRNFSGDVGWGANSCKKKIYSQFFFYKNLNYPREKLLVCVDQRTSVISLCNNRIFLTVFVCLILILP